MDLLADMTRELPSGGPVGLAFPAVAKRGVAWTAANIDKRWIGTDARFYPASARLSKKIWAGAHRLDAFYLMEAGKPKDSLAMYRLSLRYHPLPTLRDWRRVSYAALSTLGLGSLRKPLDWLRRMRHSLGARRKKA